MLFQITNHKNGVTKAFHTPTELRAEVIAITGNADEAQEVAEWAMTPVFGGFRYDHSDFEIVIIGQED